jgi:CARDB
MGNTIAAFVAMMTLALGQGVARYHFTSAWPAKVSIGSLDVDSSAPGLLASGPYKLDLEVSNQRVTGRLQRGSGVVENIPFSIEGCESVKTPNWARRATARGMPPAAGQNDRRVELKIADTSTRGCAIAGVFTPAAGFTSRTDPEPGGGPGTCCPDQGAARKPADLSIRAAKADPDDPNMIRVEVHNAGPGHAAATEVKLFYTKNGHVTTGHAPVPALTANKSVWVAVGAGLPINAADGVSARVDDPNKVSETNELNNSYKFK